MKRQAVRINEPLCWLGGNEWMYADRDPRLDVARSQRIKQALGVAAFAVVLVVVSLLSGGPQ